MIKSINIKLGIIILSLFLLLALIIGIIIFKSVVEFHLNHVTNELLHRGHSHALVLGKNFNDTTIGHVALMEQEAITSVVILDENGKILANSNPINKHQLPYLTIAREKQPLLEELVIETDWQNQPFIVTRFPIIVENEIKGTLIMFSPTKSIREAVSILKWTLTGIGIGSVFVAALLIFTLTRLVTKPLIRMKLATEEIAQGNYSVVLSEKGEDEVGDLARAINNLARDLNHYQTTRTEFLANISHELRTPITYIQGYSDILSKDFIQSEEEKKQYLSIINSECKRVLCLVRDLVSLSKLDEGNFSLNLQETDLIQLLNKIVEKARAIYAKKNIELFFDCSQQPIKLTIDAERIEQVFINLLENAKNYTPNSGKVRINVTKHSFFVRVGVEDNGIGIPQHELPYIWQRLYRVDKSRTRAMGGSGLGLAIAKEIVEMHRGKVGVKSKEGKGSTFYVDLPFKAG